MIPKILNYKFYENPRHIQVRHENAKKINCKQSKAKYQPSLGRKA